MTKRLNGLKEEWKDDHPTALALKGLNDDTEESEVADLASLFRRDYKFARECGQNLAAWDLVTYVKGSKGWQSRVKWHYPPRVIADALLGEDGELLELMDTATPPSGVDPTEYLGKHKWSLSEVISLICKVAKVDEDEVQIGLKIPEARSLLARSQGIALDEVSIRMG